MKQQRKASWLLLTVAAMGGMKVAMAQELVCDVDLQGMCTPCCDEKSTASDVFNCSLPGLDSLEPGGYDGVSVNYLSFATETSSPNLPVRAKEFEACTGGKVFFSEAANVWEDPVQDLGTKTSRGSEVYDGYFMSYSHFPEVSALDLAEHLNDRIRRDNGRLKWEDVLPKVRRMGEYRKDGVTNIDFLMYDGDFFVPLIRLDLLEKHNLALPNTWEEVVEYAQFFNGTDLNDDGDEDDFGFCHFPRAGAGFWDWWAPEAVYSTWASSDQTEGISQGFFFDEDTMEPRIGAGFRRAAEVWKELWKNGADGCITSNFATGRCAIGFAPPGCWKGVFLDPDGVNRKNENGTVVWRPTMKSGEYAEPYRFKPFGSTQVVDRTSGQLETCIPELCPKAERIPARGHHGDKDRASVLPASPLEGQLVNRAPFYWSGGLGTLIRKSAAEAKKDLMWDFFVYTNSAETSVFDVANYASWLDSWRQSQLLPGDNFRLAGWSEQAYMEHNAIMQWALSNDANGAFNLRIPGLAKYTRDVVGNLMGKYIEGTLSLDDLSRQVSSEWNDITLQQGKLSQLEVYRAALGLDAHSEVELCRLHRSLMDKKDPSVCRKYDPADTSVLLPAILVPSIMVVIAIVILAQLERKRKLVDSVWKIKYSELQFGEPPEILGRGTFGLVVLAEYRGTQVAVKRVIPPKVNSTENRNDILGVATTDAQAEKKDPMPHFDSMLDSGSFSFGADLEEAPVSQSFNKPVSSRSFAARRSSSKRSLAGSRSISRRSLHRTLSNDSTLNESAPVSFGFESGHASGDTLGSQQMGTWDKFKYGDEYGKLKADFLVEMRHLSKLRHPCVTTVMGAVISRKDEPMLVMEYMDHGSLYDMLHNDSIPIDGDLVFPILRDIAQGVRFLHAATPVVIHGDLKAHNVLVDSRFRAKVADFGLSAKKAIGATGTPLWMAPELLRGDTANSSVTDVYSFGIILYEVYSRRDPYEGEDPVEVLKSVADVNVNKRPSMPRACPPKVAALMTDCIGADPDLRPTFEEIDMRIKRLDSENVAPGEMHLSKRVRKDMKAARNEDLLLQVFPKHVADALRDGRQVEPERKELATVYFSDIVGFTNISAVLSAEKVSDMLERLYLKTDELSIKHDVFKIDTIGDAYMCVTNLVKDQEEDHVARMAKFAVEAVEAAGKIPIDVDDPSMGFVKIRAGFHSGAVVARVVGSRNPKYSIFGDAVNTASRMESHSSPGHVQCSEASAVLLKAQCAEVPLLSRGEIEIKGKGQMKTFFVGRLKTKKAV